MCVCTWRPQVDLGAYLYCCLPCFLRQLETLNMELTDRLDWLSFCLHHLSLGLWMQDTTAAFTGVQQHKLLLLTDGFANESSPCSSSWDYYICFPGENYDLKKSSLFTSSSL